jgi:serine/threonine-protein kinase
MELRPGDQFDRYRIEALLGQGGMGRVYRAYDTRLRRAVALKILRSSESPEAAAFLLREARAAAALNHPDAVAVFDVSETRTSGGEVVHHIAMELVDGETLRVAARREGVSLANGLGWLRAVAGVLAAAHKLGLVHRDVKPENVMVRHDGSVKVLDFGLARYALESRGATPSVEEALTADGVLRGTPLYMSPEQLRGEPFDARADQFAWGVMAYEILAGRFPWRRAGQAHAVAQILAGEAVPLATVQPEVPRAIANVIDRALSKDAARRFVTMAEIVAILDAQAGEGLVARSPLEAEGAAFAPTIELAPTPNTEATHTRNTSWRPPPAPSSRRRRAMAALAFGILAVAAAVTFSVTRRARLLAAAPVPAAGPNAGGPAPPSNAGGPPAYDDDTAPSTKPEAQRAYDEALASFHDGAGRWESLLRRAVQLDSDFAGAYLRLAVMGADEDNSDYRRAVALAPRLHPRERTLLDAHEAWLGGVDQARAASVSLDRYLDSHPHDEAAWLQQVRLVAGTSDSVTLGRTLDRAVAANPECLYLLAAKAEYLARPSEQLDLIDRCLRVNSRAADCIALRVNLDSQRGACEEEEADARRLLLLSPEREAGREGLADALGSRGAPVESILEALGPNDESSGAYVRPVLDFMVPLYEGDFSEVERVAREHLRHVATSRVVADHLVPTEMLLDAYDEMGEFRDAARVAEDFRARVSGWNDAATIHSEGGLVAAMARGGLLSRARANALEAEVHAKLIALGAGKYAAWAEAYANVATPEEAQLAVARFDEAGLSTGDESGYFVAYAFVLAGQAKRLPRSSVEDLARACSVVTNAELSVRAHLLLGRMSDDEGKADAACAEYAKVLARWGNARPRSRTADEARARSKRLGCGG